MKFFSLDKRDDSLRTYLTKSDEVFAQLCIILYHSEDDKRSADAASKPVKGRKKGTDDLGTIFASRTYKRQFDRRTELDESGEGNDWNEAVMQDICVPTDDFGEKAGLDGDSTNGLVSEMQSFNDEDSGMDLRDVIPI